MFTQYQVVIYIYELYIIYLLLLLLFFYITNNCMPDPSQLLYTKWKFLNYIMLASQVIFVTNLVAIPPHGLLHHTTAAHHSTSDYNSHHSLHLRRPLTTQLH